MSPNISSFSLKEICTNKWMVLLWVRLCRGDPSWQTPSCDSNIEKQLETKNKVPEAYKHYVDDTLSVMTVVETASEFLTTLNNSHPSIDFTMELEENGRLPFLGMEVLKNGCSLDTKVYKKPMDSGLLLHYHSHVDGRYKRIPCLPPFSLIVDFRKQNTRGNVSKISVNHTRHDIYESVTGKFSD